MDLHKNPRSTDNKLEIILQQLKWNFITAVSALFQQC